MNYWYSLEEIVFHEGIESISGFNFCNVRKITFPSSLKSISGFGYCSLLESVTIPDSVTDIYRAFNNCEELTDVTLGPNIERIDDHSFSDTPVMNKLKKKNVIGKCLYSCDKKAAKITIPDDIVGIKEDAFENSSIKEITIPAIKSIENVISLLKRKYQISLLNIQGKNSRNVLILLMAC